MTIEQHQHVTNISRGVVFNEADHSLPGERLDTKTVGQVTVDSPVITARHVNVHYSEKHAIKDVSIDVARNSVIAFIGPSGCGKSTFLRCINRMNDTIPNAKVTGSIKLDGVDIYDRGQDIVQLRATSMLTSLMACFSL